MYGDDTVIMAETASDMQSALHQTEEYCRLWQLKVNNSKSKIVIFTRSVNETFLHFRKQNWKLGII